MIYNTKLMEKALGVIVKVNELYEDIRELEYCSGANFDGELYELDRFLDIIHSKIMKII